MSTLFSNLSSSYPPNESGLAISFRNSVKNIFYVQDIVVGKTDFIDTVLDFPSFVVKGNSAFTYVWLYHKTNLNSIDFKLCSFVSHNSIFFNF